MGKCLTVKTDIEPVWDNIIIILSEVKEKIEHLHPRLIENVVIVKRKYLSTF